jgi:hypothetical protein
MWIGMLDRLIGQCRDVGPTEHRSHPERTIAVGKQVGVPDLRRVGGDGGDIADRWLVDLPDVLDLVIADLERIGGEGRQRQERQAGQRRDRLAALEEPGHR